MGGCKLRDILGINMSNVDFYDSYKPNKVATLSTQTGIANWLVRKGIVKNTAQAHAILIGVVVACLILIAIVYSGQNDQNTTVDLDKIRYDDPEAYGNL